MLHVVSLGCRLDIHEGHSGAETSGPVVLLEPRQQLDTLNPPIAAKIKESAKKLVSDTRAYENNASTTLFKFYSKTCIHTWTYVYISICFHLPVCVWCCVYIPPNKFRNFLFQNDLRSYPFYIRNGHVCCIFLDVWTEFKTLLRWHSKGIWKCINKCLLVCFQRTVLSVQHSTRKRFAQQSTILTLHRILTNSSVIQRPGNKLIFPAPIFTQPL